MTDADRHTLVSASKTATAPTAETATSRAPFAWEQEHEEGVVKHPHDVISVQASVPTSTHP
jgi:hypothetical protein